MLTFSVIGAKVALLFNKKNTKKNTRKPLTITTTTTTTTTAQPGVFERAFTSMRIAHVFPLRKHFPHLDNGASGGTQKRKRLEGGQSTVTMTFTHTRLHTHHVPTTLFSISGH